MPRTWNNGILESWNIGLKSHDFCVGIQSHRVNFHYFTVNVHIGAGDNHPLMAIMALPYERLSSFDAKELLEAQNPASRDAPCMTTKLTLAADAFEWIPHVFTPAATKMRGW